MAFRGGPVSLSAREAKASPARSSRPDVRNPLLALPASQRFADLSVESREALAELLKEFSDQARVVAEQKWRAHKGPQAMYFKWASVMARHARMCLRRTERPSAMETVYEARQ
jgi:hypothetical protein